MSVPAEYDAPGFPAQSDLSNEYPARASRVVSTLRDAVELQLDINTAIEGRDYQGATTRFEELSSSLSILPERITGDLVAAESRAGVRLSNDVRGSAATSNETVTVTRWIDGDSLITSAGEVRLIGIDTPELATSCQAAADAKAFMEHFAPPGTEIELSNPNSVVDTDKYGRLLRYVSVAAPATYPGHTIDADAGYAVLRAGLARARYDSRDGYQWHPAEQWYRKTTPAETVDPSGCGWGGADALFVLAVDDTSGSESHRTELLASLQAAGKTVDVFPDFLASAKAHHQQLDRQHRVVEPPRTTTKERTSAPDKQPPRKKQPPPEEPKDSGTAQDSGNRGRSAPVPEAPKDPAPPPSTEREGSGSGGTDGYTGCREYAPGGKTWKPIPCPP